MIRSSLRSRRAALVGVLLAAACGRATAVSETHPVLANLPLDSIVKALGPDVAKNGMNTSSGGGNEFETGRYDHDYSAEFTSPESDSVTVAALAEKLREIVRQRGAKVMGLTGLGNAFLSTRYEKGSVEGWADVVAPRGGQAPLDRFLIVVHEVNVAPR